MGLTYLLFGLTITHTNLESKVHNRLIDRHIVNLLQPFSSDPSAHSCLWLHFWKEKKKKDDFLFTLLLLSFSFCLNNLSIAHSLVLQSYLADSRGEQKPSQGYIASTVSGNRGGLNVILTLTSEGGKICRNRGFSRDKQNSGLLGREGGSQIQSNPYIYIQ